MSAAVLNHQIIPRRLLATPPQRLPTSFTLTLSRAKRRFHSPIPSALFTHNNIQSRAQRCNLRVATCCASSASSTPGIRFNPSTRLFVSGLSFRTTEESLRNAFKNFGELVEVKLVMDNIAKRPRGFAFIRYAMEEEAKNAIEGMHGKVSNCFHDLYSCRSKFLRGDPTCPAFLDGRVIFVEVAKPRSELRQRSPPEPKVKKLNW